jgi:dihydroorotase
MDRLTIPRPDDWHLHLRDGPMLEAVVGHTAARFARAIVMPNLKPPVTTTEAAVAYRERILAALPPGATLEPLMTLYLTDNTSPAEIERASQSGIVKALKYYPAGATTNSDAGVTDMAKTYDALAAMAEAGLPLLVHGEVTDPTVDVFDREQRFIDELLAPLAERLPNLRIVLEHITTAQGVSFVRDGREGLAATITPQHLMLNRNALFEGGLRPHHYCLPILKAEAHRAAVLEAAVSGNPRFFLGTDSAPHPQDAKETDCGCAGIYSAHAGIELYAEAFDQAGRLDRLEGFASRHGPGFYGLAVNEDTLTLRREAWTPPPSYPAGTRTLVPFRAGQPIQWKIET